MPPRVLVEGRTVDAECREASRDGFDAVAREQQDATFDGLEGRMVQRRCSGGVEDGRRFGRRRRASVGVPTGRPRLAHGRVNLGVVGLEGDVEVGAAKTEGADASTARMARRLRPSHGLRGHKEGIGRPVHRWVRCFKARTRRNGRMVQGHRDFEQPRHTGGGFEVANLALDGAHSNVVAGLDVRPQGAEGGQFSGVADLGGRPVGLDQFHRGRGITRLVVGTSNRLNLAALRRGSDALATAIG